MKKSKVKEKGRNPVPVNWVLKSREEPEVLICLKLRNVVKGYVQVPGVDYTEFISPVATYTSTIILIGITLYQ